MTILSWRSPVELPQVRRHASAIAAVRLPGAYAGRARFRPVNPDALPEALHHAIGRVVEVGFAGIAEPGDPWAGQALYLEWGRDDVFDRFFIPEQDLQFIKVISDHQPMPELCQNLTD